MGNLCGWWYRWRRPKGPIRKQNLWRKDSSGGWETKKEEWSSGCTETKKEQVLSFGKVCSKKAVFAMVPASRAHGWVSRNDRLWLNKPTLWWSQYIAHMLNLSVGITHQTTASGCRCHKTYLWVRVNKYVSISIVHDVKKQRLQRSWGKGGWRWCCDWINSTENNHA